MAERGEDGGGSRRRLTGRLAERSRIRASGGVVIPMVRELLLTRQGQPDGRRQDVIHPSEMAKSDWCHRATFYRIAGQKAPPDNHGFTLENIFAEGNFIHEKWQRWLRDTGQLWGDWECLICRAGVRRSLLPGRAIPCTVTPGHLWEYKEVNLYNDDLNISGREDGALVDANCLVEFKSVGMGTLRFESKELLARHYQPDLKQYDLDGLWKGIERPFPSHVRQVNVYMWLAREMGLPFDKTAVVYEYKVNQQAKEFSVKLSEDIVAPMLEKAREIKQAFVNHHAPPPCPFGGCAQCRAYELLAS